MQEKMSSQVGVVSALSGNANSSQDDSLKNLMPPPDNRPPKKTKQPHVPGQIGRPTNQKVMTDTLHSNEEPSS